MLHDLFFKTDLIRTYFKNCDLMPEFFIGDKFRKQGKIQCVLLKVKRSESFSPLANGFYIVFSTTALRYQFKMGFGRSNYHFRSVREP